MNADGWNHNPKKKDTKRQKQKEEVPLETEFEKHLQLEERHDDQQEKKNQQLKSFKKVNFLFITHSYLKCTKKGKIFSP